MKLRDIQRCTGQDLKDLIDLAYHFLRESKASLLIDGSRSLAHLIDKLLDYPKGYPSPYILREVDFYGMSFYVDERVLIPRSETENLIDLVLDLEIDPKTILDVGTGSGVLGITLKKLFPKSTVILTDISLEALKVAKLNSERLSVEVFLVVADLLSCFRGKFDLIVSNPPYIPSDLIGKYDRKVLYEPRLALDGGKDGFEVTGKLLQQALNLLSEGGYLIIESDPMHFHSFPENSKFYGRFVVIRH